MTITCSFPSLPSAGKTLSERTVTFNVHIYTDASVGSGHETSHCGEQNEHFRGLKCKKSNDTLYLQVALRRFTSVFWRTRTLNGDDQANTDQRSSLPQTNEQISALMRTLMEACVHDQQPPGGGFLSTGLTRESELFFALGQRSVLSARWETQG